MTFELTDCCIYQFYFYRFHFKELPTMYPNILFYD